MPKRKPQHRNDVYAVIDFGDETSAVIVGPETETGAVLSRQRVETISRYDAVHDAAIKLLACLRRTRAGLYCVRDSKIDDYRHAIGELSELTNVAVPYSTRRTRP